MKTKKESLITFRLTNELKDKLVTKTLQEAVKRNQIIKISDIIIELLEEGIKNA